MHLDTHHSTRIPDFDHCHIEFNSSPPTFYIQTYLESKEAIRRLKIYLPKWSFQQTYQSEFPDIWGYKRTITGKYRGKI